MSKKPVDAFQQKISRNDRFAQMSHQEKVIEQKKREILAKLDAKEKAKSDHSKSKGEGSKQGNKSGSSAPKDVKNVFSNDGSFLDQFKQLKDKNKLDLKLKSFSHSKDHYDKNHSDDRSKLNRWTPRRRSPSPKERPQKRNFSRFSSDKVINFEQKITINTSFSSTVTQQPQAFDISTTLQPISVTPQDVTGQPLLKNLLPPPIITYPEIIQQTTSEAVITAPPVLIDVTPPQIVQAPQINSALVLTEAPQPQQSVLVSTPLQPILTTVNLPAPLVTANVNVNSQNALPVPPPCLPTVELASIPPPNPIQVQNIPQPEPINALNIPQPAPIQVQNIPTPNSIQLNEIPNPKPLDLLTIPTPNEDNSLSDSDFIKNIPPPNKSVPPPQIQEATVSLLSAPQSVSTSITLPSSQNVLVHNMPPQAQIQAIQTPTNQMIQSQPTFSSVAVALPVGVVQITSTPPTIPSLMAQPILPPPGMGLNVNVNCPPPHLSAGNGLQPPITAFVNQVGPNSLGQMPSINLPPPGVQVMSAVGPVPSVSVFKNMNAVFPPGSPEYESMASLGRMVAECGQSIEDIVMQRKNQDPNLWFLFHKESAAYQQYRRLIEQFKQENEIKRKIEEVTAKIKTEDMYEPEKALEDNEDMKVKFELKEELKDDGLDSSERKRKRKSRWGEKEQHIAPPIVLYNQPSMNVINTNVAPFTSQSNQGPIMLSKVTRTDSGLIQYALNTYGSANLSEEDWKKAEDSYKINILYQEMIKRRDEVEQLKMIGKNKYEYDSDEETEGGTWEHKAREKEMVATELWAEELTRQAEGKHHIGDFLPPEELKRFMEKSSAVKEGRQPSFSDYKEFKIKEDNIGFKMLQKLGWTEGQGLGSGGTGIVEPVSKAPQREHTQGLGLNQIEEDEDEYESYRKRMMLAYRFRPNPLNNPRRPYY